MASPSYVFPKLKVGNHPANASDDKPQLNKKETGGYNKPEQWL
jgi:hypothetical protein